MDVEDYFQVSAFEHRVCRANWSSYTSRIENSTQTLLNLLDRQEVRGTFFVLGWVADRYPALVHRIHTLGHEIASHGYWHRLIYNQAPEEFGKDLRMSRDAIGNACGINVTAYRAPSFSIVQRSLWALEVLIEEDFRVDSSVFPIRGHDRYGVPNAIREIHRIHTTRGSLIEFPPSAWHLANVNLPVGGGYFRMLPLAMTLQALKAIRAAGRPGMFYIHPWEVDPDQPRMDRISRRTRMRHYTGLRHVEHRLNLLLKHFSFGSIKDVLLSMGDPMQGLSCQPE